MAAILVLVVLAGLAVTGRVVAEHLLALGHRSTAVLGPSTWYAPFVERRDGYLDALRAEMDRGRERRRLAQRAVGVVRAGHGDRLKQEWHGRARHQVVEPDRRRHPAPARAVPGRERT